MEQGTEVVIDESMGKWIPFFENTPEGVPHFSKIIRKPQGIGVKYKNVADAQTGIMLFLEIQEGKEAMAGNRYCDRYPKSVALTLMQDDGIFASSWTCCSWRQCVCICSHLYCSAGTFHILFWSAQNSF